MSICLVAVESHAESYAESFIKPVSRPGAVMHSSRLVTYSSPNSKVSGILRRLVAYASRLRIDTSEVDSDVSLLQGLKCL